MAELIGRRIPTGSGRAFFLGGVLLFSFVLLFFWCLVLFMLFSRPFNITFLVRNSCILGDVDEESVIRNPVCLLFFCWGGGGRWFFGLT